MINSWQVFEFFLLLFHFSIIIIIIIIFTNRPDTLIPKYAEKGTECEKLVLRINQLFQLINR